jgi:hypothetical protein
LTGCGCLSEAETEEVATATIEAAAATIEAAAATIEVAAAVNVVAVRGHPSIPLLPCFSLCLYVFPMVSIHIRPHLYHSDLLAIIDAPHQYLDIQ